MNEHEIRQIVILGGGTAGWMAAATLANVLDAKRISITLVESDAIGTVGVGEATIPPILLLNRMLGIDENDFVAKTDATFKLGIEFVNWGGLGEAYLHPFGSYAVDIETLPLHHHWLRQRAYGYSVPLSKFSLMSQAAYGNRFMAPVTDNPRSVLASIAYAYHFDAGLVARYWREYAEARGVKRIEGKVLAVDQDSETGHVNTVTLESGEEVAGEFFIDCSGFRGVLIEGTLETGYADWREWLPCDRAVAQQSTKVGPAVPYTRSIAHGAGWQWRIPLQSRMGNGHVYCSEFVSDDEAASILADNMEGEALADPRILHFTTGRRRKAWNKNVLALGLSAGFLEPLESTAINFIQSGLARLLALFPDKRFNEADIEDYNERTAFEWEKVRDFLVLHYTATRRNDTPFWQYCQSIQRPDGLERRLAQYRGNGRVFREKGELFTEEAWLAVMNGQGIEPEGWDPIADRFDLQEMRRRLDSVHDLIGRAVESMPGHESYIAQHCKSPNAILQGA